MDDRGEDGPPAKRVGIPVKFLEHPQSSNNVKLYRYEPQDVQSDVLVFFENVKDDVAELIRHQLQSMQFKLVLTLQVNMKKESIATGEIQTASPYFRSRAVIILNAIEDQPTLDRSYDTIEKKVDEWISQGSGWTIASIKRMFIDASKFQPLHGRSYFPLPSYLKNKKALINVKNNDDQCLKWALLSALYPADRHQDRVTMYATHAQELDFTGVNFPATLIDMSRVRMFILLRGLIPVIIFPLLLLMLVSYPDTLLLH